VRTVRRDSNRGAVSLNATHALLKASGGFAVSVLKRGQLDLAQHFGTHSQKGQDKLAGVVWRILDSDAAPLTYADTGSMDGSSSLYPASF